MFIILVLDGGRLFCEPLCGASMLSLLLVLLVLLETTKLVMAKEETEAIGVNADDDTTGKASNPFVPLLVSPFALDIVTSPSFSVSPSAPAPTTNASSNSSNGRTGNK
jgi:hypothetical protein